jgi:cell division protein ZapE
LRRELLEAPPQPPSLPRKLFGLVPTESTLPRGVYLWGGVGRGKTWLMDLFFESLTLDAKRRVHFHRFMHEVHAQLAALRGQPNPLDRVAREIAAHTRVLGLDELFVADIADAMILGTLFKALLAEGVTLLVTSNVPPSDLYADGLQRQRFVPAIVFLERHLDVLAIDGPTDYRLRQLVQAPIYLDSSDPGVTAKLATLFEALAGPVETAAGRAALPSAEAGVAMALSIGGRSIPLVRVRARVVWFEFRAICEGARSQEDYLEIARDYRSVIVAGVPVFDVTAENAARRFIALVDELYDRGVNLIVSAAAAPEELYRGERLAFEFRRTASRLTEMQSQAYLSRAHRA